MTDFIFLGSKITVDSDCSHEIKRHLFLGRSYEEHSVLRSRDIISANKDPSSQNYHFSSSHVWMWELDHKEGWALKNLCFLIVMLERPLESPLDIKEIIPVNPKGNQSRIFIRRTDAEAEAPILWPTDTKSWPIGKGWFWERLRAGGEGGDRGWDVWIIPLTQWTWVWANLRE